MTQKASHLVEHIHLEHLQLFCSQVGVECGLCFQQSEQVRSRLNLLEVEVAESRRASLQ